MKNHTITVPLILLLLFFCQPALIRAQDSESEKIVELEEIVVTSTRTEHQVMDTPSNINVLTTKDIEAMDAKTMADVLDKLPGAYVSNASGFVPHISLRGTRIGMSAGALVLLNGIPMSLGKFGYVDWDAIPTETIARIEVVKGPLSSLYGGDAARGVINIITKKGPEKITGKIQTIFGEYGDRRASGLIYGGLDSLDYNLSVKKVENDSYRREAGIDNWYVTGDLGYWLSEDARLGLTVSLADAEKYLAKSLSGDQKAEDRRQPRDLSFTDTADMITGLNFELSKTKFNFTLNSYYKTREKDYENYLKAVAGTPYEENADQDVMGIKTIFTYNGSMFNLPNSLSFGFDYDHDDSDIEKNKAEKKDPDLPYTKADPKASGSFLRESFGAFVQNELSVLENLTLTLGLRYDYFCYDNDADYDFSKGGEYDYNETPDFDKWNPRAGMNYRFSKNMSLYASYNTAYRAPTIYDFYGTGTYAAKGGYDLEPEKFTQYETGIRYYLTKALNLDISVYQTNIENMLDSYYDEEGNYAGKRNVSEADMKGVETSIFGSFLKDRIRYKLSHSYIDARYGEDTFARDASKNRVSIDGNRLTKMPYNTLTGDLDMGLIADKHYGLQWHIGVKAQDKYPMDNLNIQSYSGYALVESKLTFHYKNLSCFIAADNLLDKEYDLYAYYTPSSDKDNYYPAPGRTFTGGISFDF
ncbi:TonB-dependent receptor [Desulfonema magnum]|uniref:Vitamin B12 transporter, BtuB-like n=1 Tax=Desulfonema magnum TaxID=45655 RepID=A0A975GSH3_9BACT|nr:TonB-dependent receptor [Desulfonema magnum]QTA92039.1 Putative Vitamin B12 transporter, BtuB-like [Desulfonema magnum]